MFKKSDLTPMASKPRTHPFTPMRRFFLKLELLKPIVALGKRVRDQSHDAADSISEHLPERKSSQGSSSFITKSRNAAAATLQGLDQKSREGTTARVALQQHDQPLDAIVITTLPSYPFCCHEDLLMMSRSHLVEAAVLLNSRLPACSQIELADGVPDAHIRHSIETLVGIVPDMPGAPKAIKSRSFLDTREMLDLLADPEQDTVPSPPTSPLSMRVSRRQEKALPVIMSPPRLLERLEEEDENQFFTMKRPLKKRKVSRSASTSTRILVDEDMERGSSPDVFKVDSAFVNMKPRHRSIDRYSARRKTNNKTKRDYDDLPKTMTRTLNHHPFELAATNSSDEKVVGIGAEDESDNNDSKNRLVEHEDNQVAGGIENLTVGYDEAEMDV
jgi:hypothetical protein